MYSDHNQNADHHDNNIQENYCVHDDMNVDDDVQFETECVSVGVELGMAISSEPVGGSDTRPEWRRIWRVF